VYARCLSLMGDAWRLFELFVLDGNADGVRRVMSEADGGDLATACKLYLDDAVRARRQCERSLDVS